MEDRSDRLPRFPFPVVQAARPAGPGRVAFAYAFGDGAGAAAAVDVPPDAADADAFFALLAARNLAPRTAFLTDAAAQEAVAAALAGHGVAELVLPLAAAGFPVVGAAEAAGLRVRLAADEEVVPVGEVPVRVLHAPGHRTEAACLLAGVPGGRQALFGGATLLLGGAGAADGPGGDAAALRGTLARLRAVVGDVHVFPGHAGAAGPSHRPLGAEKVLNPALVAVGPPAGTGHHGGGGFVDFRPPQKGA